ncbi:hypothetical protein DOZ91_07770 [Peribacillus frigoritolerans]|nr:hypothetical protein DOZ91_07770 [Peribacillus frigoritolerans]
MESGRHKRFLLNEESTINQLDRIFTDTCINKCFEITECSNCTCQEEHRESNQEKNTIVKKDPHPLKGNRIDYSR